MSERKSSATKLAYERGYRAAKRRYKPLVSAAQEVIDKWCSGNLADAVNRLEAAIPEVQP